MDIHQIVYNSCATTLSGSSGFGVRSTTTGTPQEYIDLVNKTSGLRSYNSGKFTVTANTILSSPEKIYEFPQSYYYRKLQIEGKTVYAIGRIVSTCFDHSYYVTGKATRPGNYVAHIIMCNEFPGKKAFNLLSEISKEQNIHFIPRDWTPVQANAELVELMVGKPQPIKIPEGGFPDSTLKWDAKSLDLLFSYRGAINNGKPIVVTMNEASTASTVARFMNLLPESLAEETTFTTNHQGEGHSKEVRISFINEFYLYSVYPNLCTHINLTDGSRNIDKVEEIWRPILEKALNENNAALVDKLVKWIFSSMASENVGSSAALNESLFKYSQSPEEFTISTIDETEGILAMLSRYAKMGEITSEHLNRLIIEMCNETSELAGYEKVIGYCEKVAHEGLDTSAAHNSIRERFTDYITGALTILYDSLERLKEGLLEKYSIIEKYPKLDNILPEILHKRKDIGQISTFAKYLDPQAESRVSTYISNLKEMPDFVCQYSSLLDLDRAEAEKVDYIDEFKEHQANPGFAQFFYNQLKRESNISLPLELAKKIYDLTAVNNELKRLILNDEQIYLSLYTKTQEQLESSDYEKTSRIVEDCILPLLPRNKARKQWQLLYDVLNQKMPDAKNGIMPFYNLAKEIKNIEALKQVAPMCFEVLDKEQVEDFLNLVKEYELMTDDKVMEYALSEKTINHMSYILSAAKLYSYDYDKIFNLVSRFEKEDKAVKKFIKSNFPELNLKHNRDLFFAALKSPFIKRAKGDKGNETKNQEETGKKQK